jgi:hypothetical protein
VEHPHTRHHVGPAKWREEREKPQPELYTDYLAAALWLTNASGIFDVGKQPWLRDIVKTYSTWTYVANGSELEEAEDPDRTPDHWNEAYFKLIAYCLPGLTVGEIDGTVLGPVTALPGEAFLDVMTIFLRNVDTVYFSERGLREAEAVHVRTALARKLLETRLWKWQSRDGSTSILSHLGPAVAVVFFNEYASLVPAKCYLLEKGIDGLGPFLPVLDEVLQKGTFFFVALTLLKSSPGFAAAGAPSAGRHCRKSVVRGSPRRQGVLGRTWGGPPSLLDHRDDHATRSESLRAKSGRQA